jgi:cobyrinic acid a,c-diamide synthase
MVSIRHVIPRVVIAAPGSGHGKTSVATGLLSALRRNGLTVSPHKVGPDYIDPGYHALAAGRPGRNLDPWLVGEDQIVPMFRHGAQTPATADIAVIEGVMGLFDGASGPGSPTAGDFASTAHVARLLGAPIVLVIDASGVGASVAALVHGFASFDAGTRIGGLIFNRVGSAYHAQLLRDAVEHIGIPVLGAIHRLDQLTVPSRHLGLIPAAERSREAAEAVDALGSVIADSVDLQAVLRLAHTASPLTEAAAANPATTPSMTPRARIALAGGAAFTFGYAEHPELLAVAGADVVTFDPLRDEKLPDDVDGLVIGGGFPEAHAPDLSANTALRTEVAALARAGAPIVAECAGLLYLSRSLDDHQMCGVLDIDTAMTDRLTLGYRDAVAVADSPIAGTAMRVHGHEFHRTAVRERPGEGRKGEANAWRWTARGAAVAEGFVRDRVHASYLHTHWRGVPSAADRLVAAAHSYREAR